MSGNRSSSRSQSRADTILGVGVRIAGNINFVGVLLNQGEVIGDVSCDGDTEGTLVIGESGTVSGTIRAAHVVVGGRVEGNVSGSVSVDVQPGAHIVGDVAYRSIAMGAGGLIEGVLTPTTRANPGRLKRDSAAGDLAAPSVRTNEPASAVAAESAGGWGWGGVALVVVAVLVAVLMIWDWRGGSPPVADGSHLSSASAPVMPPVGVVPTESSTAAEPVKASVSDAVAVTPSADPMTEKLVPASAAAAPPADPTTRMPVVQAPAAGLQNPNSDQVALVQGESPGKSADFLFVNSDGPCVLAKKNRLESGQGVRIELTQGAKKRIAVGRDDIVRVVTGQDVELFYQGRRVATTMIQSGVWMSFVPYSNRGGTN